MSNKAGAPTLEQVQALYDAHRFMDAYQATRTLWDDGEVPAHATAPELVLAGRLANRLGAGLLSRHLLRLAHHKDPHHPQVRYFARHALRAMPHVLENLRRMEAQPDLQNADARLRASWLGSQAMEWATVRDFSRAHALLERASALDPDSGWVHACRANVLLLADQRDAALEAAEQAAQRAPGAPYAAGALGRSLWHVRRHEDAATRLQAVALSSQSYEVCAQACFYMCALAERLGGEQQQLWGQRARAVAARLAPLSPLADRTTLRESARLQLDAAEQCGDREAVKAHAAAIGQPFYRQVLRNMEANPAGARTLLAHHPLVQKHATCLPTSIAACMAQFGLSVDDDALAQQLTYGGTPMWAAADWLTQQGFAVRHFRVTKDVAVRLVRHGIPFILSLQEDAHAHAVAVVGEDAAAGTLLIHDPSRVRRMEMLADAMAEDEYPLGPEGMAMVPVARAGALELIDEALWRPLEALVAYRRVLNTQGVSAARQVVADLEASTPDNAITQYLNSTLLLDSGRATEAMHGLGALVGAHPRCVVARRTLLSACQLSGNRSLLRQALRGMVLHGRPPGASPGEPWRPPPTTYICQYARELSVSHQQLPWAHSLVWDALRWSPADAEAYRTLASVLATAGRDREAELPSRIACTLEPERDAHARSHADLLVRLGKTEAAPAFLLERAQRMGHSGRGSAAWITLVDWLEDVGRPDDALTQMDRAVAAHPRNAEVLGFAVGLYGRLGKPERGRAALEHMAQLPEEVPRLEAAVAFHSGAGEWQQALDLCKRWVQEAPSSMPARNALVSLTASVHGRRMALEVAKRWCAEQPDHEHLEMLLFDCLDALNLVDEQDRLLAARTQRNPDDAWAWRERGFRVLGHMLQKSPDQGAASLAELGAILRECQRLCPQHPSTLCLMARLRETEGGVDEALAYYLEALAAQPDLTYAYERAWACATRAPPEARAEVQAHLERALMRCTHRLTAANTLAHLVASTEGVEAAEKAIARWRTRFPHSPYLDAALAGVWLDMGQGDTDAARAAELLEPAVQRYPHHMSLAVLLARAWGMLQRHQAAESLLKKLLTAHPTWSEPCRRLVVMLASQGREAEALEVGRTGLQARPFDEDLMATLLHVAAQAGMEKQARQLVRQAMDAMKDSEALREQCMHTLETLGDPLAAVALGREGVSLQPDSAYSWYLLGGALWRSQALSDAAEVERAFRTALEHNANLYEAADALVMTLAERQRFDEAQQLLERYVSISEHALTAGGRLAWLHHQRGNPEEALDLMQEVVERNPSYAWGWYQLLGWLEQDSTTGRARGVLATAPKAMMDDPEFRARRLELLAKDGVEPAELDAHWTALLEDFPRHEGVLLRRFDLLWGARRHQEATAVLIQAERANADSPFVQARRLEVMVHLGSQQEALERAMAIMTHCAADGAWPQRVAWDLMVSQGWGPLLRRTMLDQADRGAPLNVAAWTLLVKHHQGRALQAGAWARFTSARALRGLLDLLDRVPWATTAHQREVLVALGEMGRSDLAVAWWRTHRTVCEQDAELWQCVGHALLQTRPGEARAWLADWEQRKGVEMWTVVNLVATWRSSSPAALQQVAQACQRALDHLPHDQCARFLAVRLCAALLRLGNTAAFLNAMDRHSGYLHGTVAPAEYFPQDAWFLRNALPFFASLMTGSLPLPDAAAQMRTLVAQGCPWWALVLWFRRGGGSAPAWERAGLLLRWLWGHMV